MFKTWKARSYRVDENGKLTKVPGSPLFEAVNATLTVLMYGAVAAAVIYVILEAL